MMEIAHCDSACASAVNYAHFATIYSTVQFLVLPDS